MLHIDPNSSKIIKAKHEFHKEMSKLLLKRIEKIKIKRNKKNVKDFIRNNIINNLDNIIVGKPNTLFILNDRISTLISSSENIRKVVEYIFDYDGWFVNKRKKRYNAYNLAAALDINTCIYCNRNYTNTVITENGEKLSRPQFDHYFDKKTYPLLALSFYNLIPCCSTCNSSLKHSSPFCLTSNIHPYVDNTIDKIKFSYRYDFHSKDGLKIIVTSPTCDRTQNNLEEFAMQEVYNVHTDLLYDLLKTRQAFSDRYLSILENNLLKNVIVSKNDIYRLVFGTEIKEKDFIKRPFSKFKNDILIELGIIRDIDKD